MSDYFDDKRALLDRVGDLSVRASGCPNGCGLHHVAGIGLQGSVRKVGGRVAPQYFVLLGGDAAAGDGGTARFGKVVLKVPARRVPQAVEALPSGGLAGAGVAGLSHATSESRTGAINAKRRGCMAQR